ncbi:MAG TPA: hypothetical protein DIV82_09675 [Brevundimonas diminuta]|nr:hypothetical protein [Brevundimonas diminuta]
MATYSKLPSGTWRAQVRRKGRYISQTFLKRDEGRAEGLADFQRRGVRPESARQAYGGAYGPRWRRRDRA